MLERGVIWFISHFDNVGGHTKSRKRFLSVQIRHVNFFFPIAKCQDHADHLRLQVSTVIEFNDFINNYIKQIS